MQFYYITDRKIAKKYQIQNYMNLSQILQQLQSGIEKLLANCTIYVMLNQIEFFFK